MLSILKPLALVLFISTSAFAQHGPSTATINELNGIAAAFRCSGAFVDLGQGDSNPAVILSAGHCSDEAISGGYKPNQSAPLIYLQNEMEFAIYYQMVNSALAYGNVKLWSILFGTMTTEDITLFQTVSSQGQLKKSGLRFFKLSDTLPKVGQKLQITSGLWGQTKTCTVEKIITDNQMEKNLFGQNTSPLEMKNSILMDKDCVAREGWSGSPIVDLQTGLVYGVASRIYTPAPNSEVARTNQNPRLIVSSVVGLKKCIDKYGSINLQAAGCQLPKRK